MLLLIICFILLTICVLFRFISYIWRLTRLMGRWSACVALDFVRHSLRSRFDLVLLIIIIFFLIFSWFLFSLVFILNSLTFSSISLVLIVSFANCVYSQLLLFNTFFCLISLFVSLSSFPLGFFLSF